MAVDLILLEFKEEVEYFLKHHPDLLKGNAKVISLLPEASELLIRHGISFDTSLEYYSNESRQRCVEQVDGMINEVINQVKITDSCGIKNAYNNVLIFYLRPYLNYIVFIVELLALASERLSVGKIWVCRYSRCDYSKYDLLPKERILGDIVSVLGSGVPVESPVLDTPLDGQSDRQRKWIRSMVCAVLFPWELILRKKHNATSIVYYSYKYRFDHIAKAFKDCDHYNLVPEAKTFFKFEDTSLGFVSHQVHLNELEIFKDRLFWQTWDESMSRLKSVSGTKKLWRHRTCDFSQLIERKITQGFRPEMLRLNRRIGSLKKFLLRLKPAVVLSHVAREFSYALGELAQQMNIPSILISHGSHVPAKNRFDRMEWFDHGKGLIHTDYRYHLLQSPWAVEHVHSMGYQGNYYRIDPIIFPTVDRSGKEQLQLKMFPQSKGKKVVLHAGTPKLRGSNRFYIYETVDEYVANIRDLIEATRKNPQLFLIVRFRPYAHLSTEQLKALLPASDGYVIATEGPFADYLKIADVMVSFSSTTIEEALINDIPVLQYDPTNRYVHIEGSAWQDKGFAHVDSVYYIGERRGLEPGLSWIVNNHLNATTIGDLFERHVFKKGEAMSVQEFVEALIHHKLPKPIDLKAKGHLEGVEIF